MDFYTIIQSESKKNGIDIYPNFQAVRSKDLMIRGGNFYAVWNASVGLWSDDEYMAVGMIDADLYKYKDDLVAKKPHLEKLNVKSMKNFDSNTYLQFLKYTKSISDNYNVLDSKLTFMNSMVTREDYVSKTLPYVLKEGDYSAWDEIIGTLYNDEERAKLEWAIGSIVSGDSRYIQKFIVLYGAPGSGKGTILDIIQQLFEGYYTTFDAKALGSNGGQFSTEVFRANPLVAIQHDGDLSRIEDNTRPVKIEIV